MNIAQIARLAGVSSAAVSRYFNNGYISEEKREAIRKVVEETGYQPSTFAQTLRTNRTRMIGVIAPQMASFEVGRIVDGIQDSLDQSGYQMLLAVTQNNPQKEVEYLRAFNQRQVDGVILLATVFLEAHHEVLREMKVPVVIVGQKLEGYCSIYYDDYHAMYEMTEYLLKKGRTNLSYIGVMPEDVAVGTVRLKAFRDAVTDAGREELADRVRLGDFSMMSGEENARALFRQYPQIDALICATDLIAAGAVQALLKEGVQIPDQVIVSGQGDSPMVQAIGRQVLSIHYAYNQSGQLAASALLTQLRTSDQSENPVSDICLGCHLVGAEAVG